MKNGNLLIFLITEMALRYVTYFSSIARHYSNKHVCLKDFQAASTWHILSNMLNIW